MGEALAFSIPYSDRWVEAGGAAADFSVVKGRSPSYGPPGGPLVQSAGSRSVRHEPPFSQTGFLLPSTRGLRVSHAGL